MDHEDINRWIEGRQGRPTVVKGTEGKNGAGILRVDVREPDDEAEEISWGEFFQTFRGRKLAFLHRDGAKDVKPGRLLERVGWDRRFRTGAGAAPPGIRSVAPAGPRA